MNHDPIADMLTRVRNAIKASHTKVDVPASRLKVSIAHIWKENGFIKDYKLYQSQGKGVLRIYPKYLDKQPAIQGIERISSPRRRVYVGYKDIMPVKGEIGIEILSTSKGILSSKVAKDNKVGGEVICRIW